MIERYKISQLCFADDLVLLVSNESSFQHTLNGFATTCDIAGMKISTSKTKLHFSRTSVQCFLHVGNVSLQQVKFKYLRVSFKSDGRQDEELDVQSGKPCAVTQALHRIVVLK